MYTHDFTRGARLSRPVRPMTLEEVREVAPSAFAVQAHESRSDRYAYIPTLDVLRGMEDAGFLPFKATQSKARDITKREYTKHMIRFRASDQTQALAVGDSLPEIVLVNSHDGSSAYHLMAGIFRLVCSNGLVIAESMIGAVHIRHSGDVVRDVIRASRELIADTPGALERIGQWSQLQLTSGEREAFAGSAHTLRFADAEGQTHTPITPTQLLMPRREADRKADLWSTLNVIQENTIKGGLHAVGRDQQGRRRRTTSRAVNGIDQDVKLNRALWQLAERMAELKGAQAVAAA